MGSQLATQLRLWNRLFGWKRRREAAATLEHAPNFLQPGDKVLDIGCGMGYAVDVLREDYNAVTFACDVVFAGHQLQRFAIFDGRNLPYADKSVDVALLIFVLHHAQDASILLREAARIARRAVIVVEDTPRTRLGKSWGRIHIRRFSRRHNIPWTGRIRSDHEWHQLFRSLAMPVRRVEALRAFERIPPIARTVYVLQPVVPAITTHLPPTRRAASRRTTI
ncbi:MAG: class I SAM-dependent methyltransferase [Gemmatimonadota bacterium]